MPLGEFVEGIVGDGYRMIDEDFGNGFVKLCAAEADRRQAVQDIRSVEDILIELLRNSRDAGAKNIFIATARSDNSRTIVVVDDGSGIPEDMTERIFEPHVTSKLESAHLDRWGMHGRGMALFSIRENSEASEVVFSRKGLGASMRIIADTDDIPEKSDQSAFPRFEIVDGVYVMRGPKNIYRVASEFALSHESDLNVYCGSPAEILATILKTGKDEVPASERLFHSSIDSAGPAQLLASSTGPEDFADRSSMLGLPVSSRTARRILDGDIRPLPSLTDRLRSESMPHDRASDKLDDNGVMRHRHVRGISNSSHRRISETDLEEMSEQVGRVVASICSKYYVEGIDVSISQRKGHIIIDCEMAADDA